MCIKMCGVDVKFHMIKKKNGLKFIFVYNLLSYMVDTHR